MNGCQESNYNNECLSHDKTKDEDTIKDLGFRVSREVGKQNVNLRDCSQDLMCCSAAVLGAAIQLL